MCTYVSTGRIYKLKKRIEEKEKFINNGVTNKQSTFLFYKVLLRYFVFPSKVQIKVLFKNCRYPGYFAFAWST